MIVKYSPQLLKDTDALVKNFTYFMTLNLVHADKGLDPEGKMRVEELIRFSTASAKQFNNLFRAPIMTHEVENRQKLEKYLPGVVEHLHNYLQYAEPILKRYKPELHQKRFHSIWNNYFEFHEKYLK